MNGIQTRDRTVRELEALLNACRGSGDPDVTKAARSIQTATKVNAIMSLLPGDDALCSRIADFDADADLINFRNGTLLLSSGEIREHDPRDLLTKMAKAAFDPAAPCPYFDKLLNDALPVGHREFILRLFGYTLLGDPKEQVFAILHGVGANGKSTLLNAVAGALGDYAVNVEPSSFIKQKTERVRNDLARLKGARLVSTSELATGEILDAALVKRFTGGDIITARALYKEYFEFQPAFVVFMTTNALPVIDGADAALGRRVVLVPFRNVIGEEDRDKGLPAKLRAEASGIFNRLLQGLADYRRVGLAIPEDLKAEAADYTETSDMIAAFLVAEYDTAPGENVGARLLYMTYQQWCGENGLRPMSQPQFRPEMIKKLGYAPKKTNAGAIWPGLRGRKPTI